MRVCVHVRVVPAGNGLHTTHGRTSSNLWLVHVLGYGIIESQLPLHVDSWLIDVPGHEKLRLSRNDEFFGASPAAMVTTTAYIFTRTA